MLRQLEIRFGILNVSYASVLGPQTVCLWILRCGFIVKVSGQLSDDLTMFDLGI